MWSSQWFREIGLAAGLPFVALTITLAAVVSASGNVLAAVSSGIVVLATGVLSAWLTFRVISRASAVLDQLHRSAQAAEQGDFSVRVPVLDGGGLGLAASAFNSLRENLGKRISQLQENRDRMTTVLSGMVEGVLAVDPQQRVLLANEACQLLLGIATRGVVGRPLLEVVRNLEVQQAVVAALRGHPTASREVPITTTSRRVVQVLATRLPGDPCPGVVVVLQDVSELRRLESLRRDFVANVSHELKTPLSVIQACAETLRLGAIHDQENNLHFVKRIEEQATRLHQLILDLLHLARVETGQEAFEFAEIPLSQICQVCLQQHTGLAVAGGVTLSVEEASEEVLVWADADGLRIIADNLVTNAIKYTPASGSVRLRYRRESNYGLLEVVDSGIGIAPQAQERIFERFYRVDKARSRDLGGTGLGLAIVKHLTQAFGGEVGLTSAPGQGSTFRVRLPLAPTTPGIAARPVSPPANAAQRIP